MSSQRLTQILLLLNATVVSISLWSFINVADGGLSQFMSQEAASFAPPEDVSPPVAAVEPISSAKVLVVPDSQHGAVLDNASQIAITSGGIGTTNSNGFYFVQPKEGERNFYEIAKKTGTDKVTAPVRLPDCLKNDASCTRPGCVRPECRPWGHHYDTIYQQRMGPYSRDDTDPFQFLEIGFYN
eukprot:scaffold13004_cov94-Skeletonema_dohrnii-CCMP3373.AAC.1